MSKRMKLERIEQVIKHMLEHDSDIALKVLAMKLVELEGKSEFVKSASDIDNKEEGK